jgi:hypothetical protein
MFKYVFCAGSNTQLTSSEYDELVADMVSSDTRCS